MNANPVLKSSVVDHIYTVRLGDLGKKMEQKNDKNIENFTSPNLKICKIYGF
jgi:hypothetical protein